ncbi:hypothetical protein Tco_1317370 [Tanacetum coccineum]
MEKGLDVAANSGRKVLKSILKNSNSVPRNRTDAVMDNVGNACGYESPLKGANMEDGMTEDGGADVMYCNDVNGYRCYLNIMVADPNTALMQNHEYSMGCDNMPKTTLEPIKDGGATIKQAHMGGSVANNVATSVVPDKGLFGNTNEPIVLKNMDCTSSDGPTTRGAAGIMTPIECKNSSQTHEEAKDQTHAKHVASNDGKQNPIEGYLGSFASKLKGGTKQAVNNKHTQKTVKIAELHNDESVDAATAATLASTAEVDSCRDAERVYRELSTILEGEADLDYAFTLV